MENNSNSENKVPQIEEEIDFWKVIKNPGRWFGLVYPYFFTIFLIGGIYFVERMNTAYMNNVAPVIADSTNTFTDIANPVKGSVSKGIDLKTISEPPQTLIEKGKTLYQTNCASCHGQTGMGDGPAGAALNPKPRNFHQNEGWKNGRRVSDMFTTMQKGIPGSGMPAFEYLPNEDKFAMIEFIRTFKNDFPQVTDQEIAEMDKSYNLTQGIQKPNQIPVAKAVDLVSEESLPRVKNVYDALSFVNNNANERGVIILNNVSTDKLKVLSYLSMSQSWTGSVDDFIRTVTSSLDVNGFKSDIVNLTENDWNELYSFLRNLNLTATPS